MKKLITGAIVAAALAVSATPAFAIHHGKLPFVVACAHSDNALGVPAAPVLVGTPAGAPNPGNSASGLEHNTAAPKCPALR